MPTRNDAHSMLFAAALMLPASLARAQHQGHMHADSEKIDQAQTQPTEPEPALPEGRTLDEVLDQAAKPAPEGYPDPIMDNMLHVFTLIDQLEYRVANDGNDQLGWDAQGWIGHDYNRFVWKSEGEASFDGADEGESENDFLYSRLVSPFWYVQAGVQYANSWDGGDYDDRVSGVLALQGLAPGKFEVDASLYISEDTDITVSLEAEYDLRLTQRLVLQPRAEIGLSAQDVDDRALGQGLTDTNLDLRLRYEITRQFAPYVGVRYRFLSGETRDLAGAMGDDTEDTYLIFGVRLAF